MVKKLLSSILIIGTFCVNASEKNVNWDKLKIYKSENILRNGDFQKKQFSVDLPLGWLPAYNGTIPEKRSLFSLKDGVFTMKAPFNIWQFNDITPEAATEFILSFESEVKSGILYCSTHYRSRNGDSNCLRSQPLFKRIMPEKDFVKHKYKFNLGDPRYVAGSLQIVFAINGNPGEVNLRNIVLKPVTPKTKNNAKSIFMNTGNGKIALEGIIVSENHTFYELQAARYLQKFLYVGLGRYINIYIVPEKIAKKNKGMVLIGNAFLDEKMKSDIKSGGYAIVPDSDHIRIGGKDDGAIHGVLKILASIGLEFYTMVDFTMPVSNTIIFKIKNIENPVFSYRYITGSDNNMVSRLVLGDSSNRLRNNCYFMGMWRGADHPLGFLIDPFFYFDKHPEYYALNPTWKKRTWKSVQKNLNSKSLECKYLQGMQICYSNPNVQKIVSDHILEWFRLNPEMKICFLFFGDRYGPSNWCACENCKRFGANDTDRWLKFINVIAGAVKKKYPGKLILTGSYAETKARPIKIKPASNVVMYYTVSQDGWKCKNHFDCAKNRAAGWKKDIDNFLKDYKDCFKFVGLYGPSQPGGIIRQWAAKMKYFAERGVHTGILSFGSKNMLQEYVLCKLAWNPSQDTNRLISKFTDFYYGKEAGPYMKQYIDLIETSDEARKSHSSKLSPSLVNYEFITKAEPLLNKVIILTADPQKKKSLRQELLSLLTLYVKYNNKVTGLRGKQLKDFAETFANFLKLSTKFKPDRNPWWMKTYRQFIQEAIMLDIGNTKPWYNSPVMKKILADPVGMIAQEEKSYEITPYGLKFDIRNLFGGLPCANYQYKGIPENKKVFSKILRRKSSPQSIIRAAFDLEQAPTGVAVLEIEGLDNEKPERVSRMLVKINGKFVARHYPVKFSKNDWSAIRVAVHANVLKKGGNSLEIFNTTLEKKSEYQAEMGAEAEAVDYTWGWFMISDIKLHLPKN